MIFQSKLSVAVASGIIGLGICVIGVIYHYNETTRGRPQNIASPSTVMTTDPDLLDQVQTPKYLMAHPATLKAVELQCQDGTAPNTVAICDNVHEAEAGLLALEYKNASAVKSQ